MGSYNEFDVITCLFLLSVLMIISSFSLFDETFGFRGLRSNLRKVYFNFQIL